MDITAFKPPADGPFVTDYNGIQIDSSRTFFIPLENKNRKDLFGVRLIIDEFQAENEADFRHAAFIVLDTLLGEKANAMYVNHVEVAGPIDGQPHFAAIPLSDLPDYITRKKVRYFHKGV